MSPQNASLGKVIDPFRFAAEARTQSGEVEVAKLPRLKDSLANGNAVLSWRLEGWLESSVLSGREEPRLKLLIDGALSLRCQRCLNGIDWQLAIATVLQPVRAGQQIPDEELEDDEVDAIEVEEGLDVMALLEEEILLALPLAPRHEKCDSPRGRNGAGEESPFAALASLRGSNRAD